MIENERRCGNCKYLGAQTGEFLDMYGTMRPLCIQFSQQTRGIVKPEAESEGKE